MSLVANNPMTAAALATTSSAILWLLLLVVPVFRLEVELLV
jgi:hypothetical protein